VGGVSLGGLTSNEKGGSNRRAPTARENVCPVKEQAFPFGGLKNKFGFYFESDHRFETKHVPR